MTDAPDRGSSAEPAEEPQGPVVRDRRRSDPHTYQPRRSQEAPGAGAAGQGADVTENDKPEPAGEEFVADGEFGGDGLEAPLEAPAEDSIVAAKISELEELAAERTADLQRLQAEYANYKKRVDRDRALSRQGGIEAVVLDLLPVLDSIEAAREHAELVGGFKLVADELEKVSAKYGLEAYGEVGEAFDPQLHEALMHMPYADPVEVVTIAAVMQKGVKLNDRVLRPARVGVADPDA
ncbi:MAG: nucleotide exchange factor GrpE [Micropruina sp.]|nr:MAG: nucleotide exchange factor GrpE [Micropruina sp.]